MIHSDPVTLRQSNGYVGEHLTAGLLARHFVVLKSSVDRDGADFLIDLPTNSAVAERVRARGIRAFGIVQAKFFENGNAVYIDPSYSEEQGRPRHNFFLLLHSEDENKNPTSYFLTAAEVCALPTGKNGLKRFSVTENDDKHAFRYINPAEIAERIRSGIEAYELSANEEYLHKVKLPLRMRAGFNAREVDTEYLLKIIALPKTDQFPEHWDARVVFARSAGGSVARPIDARWDLFNSTGTWSWGYKGEGPKLLAMSILAHYMGPETVPTREQHRAFLNEIIALLDRDSDHIVKGTEIEWAIDSDAG